MVPSHLVPLQKGVLGFTLLALLFAALMRVDAQELSLFNVDASAFPRITANYIAFDESGQPYSELNVRDFRVSESTAEGNTADLTATLTHDCVELASTTSVSLVLIVDESFSMDETLPGGKRRLDYVKDALVRLVGALDWNSETAVSIIGFSGRSRLICDWQTRPEPVLAAIGRLTPLGATNYEAPFTNSPTMFEQMEVRPPSIPKVSIFITDGFPNPEIVDRPRFEQRVIQQSRQQGIRNFSVTLMIGRTDRSIFDICRATGGRSIVADERTLVDLMSVLAFETTRRSTCTLSWISPMVCTDAERQRAATVRLLRGRQPTTTVGYRTPEASVYRIAVAPQPVIFDDVPPRARTTASVTIRAENTPLTLTSASINAPEFFSVVDFRPTTIPLGGSATFTVAFTQGAERRTRQGVLSFVGTPFCTPTTTLIGGGGAVVLTSPNGGEVLSACTGIDITWSGVGADQPVRLEFSCDGINWHIIADTIFGSSYRWTAGELCETGRIRVSTIPGERLLWAFRHGSGGNETVGGIGVRPDGQRVFAGGSFSGTTTIGSFSANSTLRAHDGYLATLDADGNVLDVRFLRGGPGREEHITAVRGDRDGNVIVAGHSTSSRVTFGSISWDAGPIDERTAFVGKYAPDGRQLWRYVMRGTTARSADVTVDAVVVRPLPDGNEEVVVYGRAENVVSVATAAEIVVAEVLLPVNSTWYYTLRIDQTGPARVAAQPQPSVPQIPSPLRADDAQGYRYHAGDFEGGYTVPLLPPVFIESVGQRDIWVARSVVGVPTSDVSDRTFRITKPVLAANQSRIVFAPTATDRTATYNDARGLRNDGTEALVIDSVRIMGPHADDFRLVGVMDGTEIDPGEVVSIELVFTPSAEGMRRAVLEVFASCHNNIVIDLEGEGRPDCPWDVRDTIDLGRIVMGTSSTQRFDCILRSNRRIQMRADVRLRGSADFRVTPLGPVTMRFNQCITVDVTFTPSAPGRQTAQIDLNLPIECSVAFVTILAEGVLPDLEVTDYDFGNKRLGTTTSADILVVNNGSIAVDVESITPLDAGVAPIRYTLPTLPLQIGVGDTIRIPVEFTPTDRSVSRSRIAVQGRGLDSARIGTVRGAGFQPTISANGYVFQPVLVGTVSSEAGWVRLRNTDTQWPLTIADVRFETPSQDFQWNVLPVAPIVIPPSDSIDLAVLFSPQAGGRRTVNVVVDHDGRPGPDPFPPFARTTVVVEGFGLQRSVLPPVDMGVIAWCNTVDTVVSFTNDLVSEDLVVTSVEATGDAAAFTISPATPFVIPAGGSFPLRITFAPSASGSFAASFAYQNSRQLDLTVNVQGRAIELPTTTAVQAPATIAVGDVMALSITTTLPADTTVDVDALTIAIEHPDRVVRYRGGAASSQPGWDLQPIAGQGASVTLRAIRRPGVVRTDVVRFVPQFEVFLAPAGVVRFQTEVIADDACVLPSQAEVSTTLNLACADIKRVVSIGGTAFAMSAPRYHAGGAIDLTLGVGIAGPVRLMLYDVQGRCVTTHSVVLNEGTFELCLAVPGIPPGWYALSVESGPFLRQRPVIVVD